MSSKILSNFYRCTVESILTSSITVWYGNCTAQDRKALQRVVKTAQHISGAAFHSLQDIYSTRVTRRAHNIIKDSTHPQHRLFTLLPSGGRYQSLRSRTTRMTNSFYPQAIRLAWPVEVLYMTQEGGMSLHLPPEVFSEAKCGTEYRYQLQQLLHQYLYI
ncbi:hypothetical protein N1851_027855 [Merluccius polli]|uniref:Uncharacterized protein n=1 Tax=Merluccius polli TaxID=89951 RepID=A0AA47NSZ3_MERPO|nr:hypothetical protein N1851_027855 [Merluccius polli]